MKMALPLSTFIIYSRITQATLLAILNILSMTSTSALLDMTSCGPSPLFNLPLDAGIQETATMLEKRIHKMKKTLKNLHRETVATLKNLHRVTAATLKNLRVHLKRKKTPRMGRWSSSVSSTTVPAATLERTLSSTSSVPRTTCTP